jgi:hypothetical protein
VRVEGRSKAEPDVAPSGEEARARPRNRSNLRWRSRARFVALIILVVICLGAAGTAWIVYRGLTARDHLARAATLVQQLRRELEDVHPAASKTLVELQLETRAARSDTRDPVWRLAAHTPTAGDDLAAVRTVASALDDLAHDGLPPLVETAGTLDVGAVTPKDGRIDLARLQRAAPRLAAANAALSRARDRIAAIAVDGLVGPIKAAVVGLLDDLDSALDTTATAARCAALLPPMLGAGGPREYLVLFQNLAEVRATGGMPGAYVVVRADLGRISIVDQGTAAGLKPFNRPVLKLATSDRALYRDRLGKFPANINLTPHFPTAGRLAQEMYRRRTGRTVDGVLATDPVALSYLLRAIGKVSVPNGADLTAANAVPVLLSRMYAREVSLEEQDRYFGAAAKAVFEAVVQRAFNPSKLLAELARAAGERRLLVWSARPAESKLLAGTVLEGVMPASDGAQPTVGVFLNDGSGAKLGYYLTQSADLAVAGGCRADGRRELTLRVTLGSTAPRTGLSPYVLGMGLAGDPYTVRTVVSIYSSTGGVVDAMALDGQPTPFGSGRDRRRAVGIVTVDLKPGTKRTLEVSLLTGIPAVGSDSTLKPRLWTTPGVNPWKQSVGSADGCPISR